MLSTSVWTRRRVKSTDSQIHPSFRADLTCPIRVNTGWHSSLEPVGELSCVSGDRQAELRGLGISGLPWLDSDLLSWSLWVNDCAEAGWAQFVETLHVTVCHQSSRVCWHVLLVRLDLFQLAGRPLVGSSISPLSYTEGHHIRLVLQVHS